MVNLETLKVSWYRNVHTRRNEVRPLLEVLAAIRNLVADQSDLTTMVHR